MTVKKLYTEDKMVLINTKNRGILYMGTTQLKLADFLRLNLTVPMVYQELLKLTPSNYYMGPEEDRDGSEGEVWVFRHPVSGVELYIKMKLFQVQGEDYLKILSFHQRHK
jgi:hypothetical protein